MTRKNEDTSQAHEYKNGGSAQGQAMGMLAGKSRKTLLLTGTLMGGTVTTCSICCSAIFPGGYRPSVCYVAHVFIA